MKRLIGLIVVGGLLLAGCAQPSVTTSSPPELYDKVWISPGEVDVGNFFPGARAEPDPQDWLTIHNGNDYQAKFSITYRQPDKITEGYVRAPDEAKNWVIIDDPAPVLKAKETRQVLVAVEMPQGANAPPKWEFWIVVKDETQPGMVQTELACKWLVTMKQ
jgi:hypothetical protein